MKQNTAKITPELIRSSRLFFQPETMEESIFIQQQLFALGVSWVSGGTTISPDFTKGMVSINGMLYAGPDNYPQNLLANAHQFEKPFVSAAQSFQQEQFNKIAAKIEALAQRLEEVSAKVDKVHDEMFPVVTDTKPKLKPAGQG